ncbi:hypothetical protein NGG03_15635 [Klebsiella michiganensis]|uniref:hypothetical protein n=1 Tax=Klebsiella michiganensis TaxID=1134687 RepID=UPI002DBD6BBD|nr:hypothetical protein [Klebsiella michiganensis]MEB8291346.1 hypothetical protein [Klebsiella michiganensis]
MKRRSFLLFFFCNINLVSFTSFAQAKPSSNRQFDSADELIASPPRYQGEIVTLSSYHKQSAFGGGNFIAKKVSNITDYGVYFNTTSELSWCRIDASRRLFEPEWFGCVGDGIADDSLYFNRLLNSLSDGDSIVLRQDAIYYNAVPTKNSRFILKKNNITIIGNNAKIIRRPTSIDTKKNDVGNLATLKITGNNTRIVGKLTISGGESDAHLKNRFYASVSQEAFTRGFSSSHALFVENVDGLYLSPELKCENAIFPLYVNKSRNLKIFGEYSNSGQVYPVKGKDLQLGSCVKIANSQSFLVDIKARHSAYCGLEIEPYCDTGDITVDATDCYMHGTIIHQFSNNIKVNVKLSGSEKGAGIRISSGSHNIFGKIIATNCDNAVLIVSKGYSICKNLNLSIEAGQLNDTALIVYNDDKKNISLTNAKLTFLKMSSLDNLISIINGRDISILLDKNMISTFDLHKQKIVDCEDTNVSFFSNDK